MRSRVGIIRRLYVRKRGELSGSLSHTAQALGMTKMRVKRARAYAKLMIDAGVEDPYRMLTEPPANASRWRFRRHPSTG